MSSVNVASRAPALATHEGGRAIAIGAEAQLRRLVMSCLLWEGEFYVDGAGIAEAIREAVAAVEPEVAAQVAVEARTRSHLRHAPLWIAREMARLPRHKALVGGLLPEIILRADELSEFLALYWLDGRQPLSKQVKLGIARAFRRFNAYGLAKYDRAGKVRLRDALFLTHAKPEGDEQAALWKALVTDTLPVPDTWEAAAGAGAGGRENWERLLAENKLGALALLRNLRNMRDAGVPPAAVFGGLETMRTDRVLPFRFIAAARAVPEWEPEIERAMLRRLGENPVLLPGRTVVLVDVSDSMNAKLSGRSDMTRMDAACGVAIIAREMFSDVRFASFSNEGKNVPARRGFALRDAIVTSQPHGGTYLGRAVTAAEAELPHERLIVITDEQAADTVTLTPKAPRAYVINVASNRNGVGYGGWVHIDGWSESVMEYIRVLESAETD